MNLARNLNLWHFGRKFYERKVAPPPPVATQAKMRLAKKKFTMIELSKIGKYATFQKA